MRKNQSFFKGLSACLGILLLIIAVWILRSEFSHIKPAEILSSFSKLCRWQFIAALLLTFLTYLIMTGYDAFGIRYAGSHLPYWKIVVASFVGDTFNANCGLSAIVGSTVKYRFYSSWGMENRRIAGAIGLYTLAYWLGFSLLCGFSLLLSPSSFSMFVHLPLWLMKFLGCILILPTIAFLFLIFLRKKPFRPLRITVPIPTVGQGVGLLCVSCCDWFLAGTVFFVLMPDPTAHTWIPFFAAFLAAHLAGVISQSPGGILVFETVALVGLSKTLPAETVAASLLAFRLIFFLIPFVLGVILLGTYEFFHSQRSLRSLWSRVLSLRVKAHHTIPE